VPAASAALQRPDLLGVVHAHRDAGEPGQAGEPAQLCRPHHLVRDQDVAAPAPAAGLSEVSNIIDNMMGSVRRVCRNVKRWRDASMALRWTAAAMLEAAKGCRRLKAKSQLPKLRAALLAHRQKLDPAFSVSQAQQAA
jgi:hypothetical protein